MHIVFVAVHIASPARAVHIDVVTLVHRSAQTKGMCTIPPVCGLQVRGEGITPYRSRHQEASASVQLVQWMVRLCYSCVTSAV